MGPTRRHLQVVFWLIVWLIGAGFSALPPAAVGAQDEPTATPDAAGVIYAEVRPNDSLWAVAVRAGISIDELLSLNSLSQNSLIQPGQLLIVGYGTPAPSATPDLPPATATATRPPPTPTPTPMPPPRTALCLVAFDDINQNGVRNLNEPLKAAVAFTVFNERSVVDNYVTDGVSEPYCLENLQPGNYQVTRSVQLNETLTTAGDWAIRLTSGSVLHMEFGSYTGSPAAPLLHSDTDSAGQPAVAGATSVPPPEPVAQIDTSRVAHESSDTVMIIFGTIGFVGLFVAAVLFLMIRHGSADGKQES